MNFNDYVKKYQSWKVREKKLPAKLDKAELSELRESWSRKVSEYQTKKRLTEALSNFRKFKEKKTGESKITYDEYRKIKESIQKETKGQKLREDVKPGSFEVLVENYRKYKKASGEGDKVSYREVKSLREAFKKANGRLREADAGFDPTQGMDGGMGAPAAGADPMAAPGADPMAAGGTTVDPAIAAQIQDVKNSIDALATAAGIQTADMGADPNAGTPPVDGMGADGMGAQDPNAGAAPMMEATVEKFKKYVRIKEKREATEEEIARLREKIAPKKTKVDVLKERIAAREAQLREGNAAQELGKKVLSNLGGPQAKASFEPDKTGSKGDNSDVANNKMGVEVPAASKLSSGVSASPTQKGTATTWPTKKPQDLGALQGAGATQKGNAASPKVKESTEQLEECGDPIKEAEAKKDEKKDELKESVRDVTSIYVDKYLNTPKLDFQRIRESLAAGNLG